MRDEKFRVYDRKYYAAHREEQKARTLSYYHLHKNEQSRARVFSYNKTYYATNKEKILIQNSDYRKGHREEAKVREKVYYAAHPEKMKAKRAARRAAHREEMAAYNVRWRSENLEKVQTNHKKQQAKRRALGFFPLNKPFPSCEGHHVDNEQVIHMTHALHRSVYHNHYTGQGMAAINAIAYNYLFKQEVETAILKGA